MKHILPALFLASASLTASAQLDGNGFYRVENAITDRYAYLTSHYGKVIASATTADVRAIELWKGFDKAASDPATILYLDNISGSEWNITAQGIQLHNIIGSYVKIRAAGDGTYYAYGTKSGATKYLGDANANLSDARGEMSTEVTDTRRKWWFKPVGTSADNYFGIQPTVTAGGKHYHPFYAAFPFSTYSQGVKAYYISKVQYGLAVMTEATGTVAASTPVFFECQSTNPADNKLNIGGTGSTPGSNQLGGVYFNRFDSPSDPHNNRTAYNKNTMRLLGTDAEGRLAFVTGDIEYLPANQSYLKVPAGTPATVRVVTEAEFNALVAKLPTSVTLDRTEAAIYAGGQTTLSATIAPADCSDTSLTWSSSNTAVATVSASGTVKGVAAGTATITATTVNGIKATCKITVNPQYPTSVSVAPAATSVYETETVRLTATLSPADVEHKGVTWTSSDNSLATVDADGNVKGVKAGTATITATTANGVKASATVTVKSYYPVSIKMSSPTARIRQFESLRLGFDPTPADVRDRSASWTSSDTSIATVSDNGTVTGVAQGTCTVTATTPNGASASCQVTISAPAPQSVSLDTDAITIEIDKRMYLYATVLPEDAYKTSVDWSSSDTSVATVNILGQVRGIAPGTCTVTATTVNGLTASATVTVTEKTVAVSSVTVTPSTASLKTGDTLALSATVLPADATDPTVTWTSDNDAVVTVDAEGRLTAIAEGTATVTATAGSRSSYCYVTVTADDVEYPTAITLDLEEAEMGKGETLQLTATIEPEDVVNRQVIWMSADPETASVDQNGLVTAHRGGHTVITANTANSLSASCRVNVNVPVETIVLDQEEISAVPGTTFTLVADVLPEDATDKEISWTSDNPNVADVNDEGDVTIQSIGIAVITATATDGSGVYAVCRVTGISGIAEIAGENGPVDVYTTDGILLHRNAGADTLSTLAGGVYVVGGKKIIVR